MGHAVTRSYEDVAIAVEVEIAHVEEIGPRYHLEDGRRRRERRVRERALEVTLARCGAVRENRVHVAAVQRHEITGGSRVATQEIRYTVTVEIAGSECGRSNPALRDKARQFAAIRVAHDQFTNNRRRQRSVRGRSRSYG